jgi:hypothetical protein
MALHSKSDFAKLCGMKLSALSVYLGRGKVIPSGDYINDKLQVNKAFQEKWAYKNLGIVPVQKIVPQIFPSVEVKQNHVEVKINSEPIPNVKKPELNKKQRKPNTENSEFLFVSPINQMDMKIKEVELSRKEEDLEIAKLKRQKMAGEIIPVDLVKSVFSQLNKASQTAFKNAADDLLMEIQQVSGFGREKMAELRGKLVLLVNKAIEESCSIAIDSVDSIVDEYREIRQQGERDR